MNPALTTKYDLRLPRYTSYPTAPHFSPAVGPDRYGEWLSDLPADGRLSLYLHIAYCAEMCWFCGCHTKITRQYAPIADYMDCLWREIDMVAARLPQTMAASHVHFGGGSPTILTPDDFVATIDRLRRRFAVLANAEIAVELDPRTADEDYVAAMAGCGVTRASIGVQDFNPQVQQAINRIQPYDVTAQVITWLRRYGVPEINMDLVYGLPHQTAESLIETIDLAIGFTPKRIALFGYAPSAGANMKPPPPAWPSTAIFRSGWIISPGLTTKWRLPWRKIACTVISRDTPPTVRQSSWASGLPASARCLRATSPTKAPSTPTRR